MTYPAATRAQAVVSYQRHGSARRAATEVGVSPASVLVWARSYGIPVPTRPRPARQVTPSGPHGGDRRSAAFLAGRTA